MDYEAIPDALDIILTELTDMQKDSLARLYRQVNGDIKRGLCGERMGEHAFDDLNSNHNERLDGLNKLKADGLVVNREPMRHYKLYSLTGVGYVACVRLKL